MASEEEVTVEVEAVEAVYGDDCVVLHQFPPHLHVHIKPRTADDSSQQFVEATIGIRASAKYPDEPPVISVVDSKGLDIQRQNQLVASIRDRAVELSSCLMIVALVEEAVENLSRMNHPDGVCPLCLFPLLDEEEDGSAAMPFMKLMTCFHCFHCECIRRWYNWQQTEEGDHEKISEKHEADEKESTGVCPVCRKVFLGKDIEHVLDLAEAHPDSKSSETYILAEEDLVQSESEKLRRLKFEETLKLQQEKGGLIEPKKHEVLLPGMFLPPPPPPPEPEPSTTVDKETTGEQGENSTTVPSGSSNTNNRPSSSRYARKQSHRGRGRGHGRGSWDQQPREWKQENQQPREQGDRQPREQRAQQPREQGNQQLREHGNRQPREGNQQSREGNQQSREGNQQPREQGNRQPREGNQQPREQGNRQPREGNQQPRELGNWQPREWKQGNQQPREQGNRHPREWRQGNRQPREWRQGNQNSREQGNQQPTEQGKQKESGATTTS